MRMLSCMVIVLLLAAIMTIYATDEDVIDTGVTESNEASPRGWNVFKWSVLEKLTGALAFFTLVLTGATIYYAIQAKAQVRESRKLLESNQTLTALTFEQNNITETQNSLAKAQLLRAVVEFGTSEREIVDELGLSHELRSAILIYLGKVSKELLGADFSEKVRLKLDDGPSDIPIFGIKFKRGESKEVSLAVWERFREVSPDNAAHFSELQSE